jgi:hypothetical protein
MGGRGRGASGTRPDAKSGNPGEARSKPTATKGTSYGPLIASTDNGAVPGWAAGRAGRISPRVRDGVNEKALGI